MTLKPKPDATMTKTERAQLRRKGLRPIEIWVPDVRAATFKAEARRQSTLAARSATAEEDQAFVDAISEWPDT